ncbi:hypothetical protein C8R43DRAFT_241902 [Mycena crocata]|nr:hypothetical protein C8R43DRAFT_241902 [Mycena crocata]
MAGREVATRRQYITHSCLCEQVTCGMKSSRVRCRGLSAIAVLYFHLLFPFARGFPLRATTSPCSLFVPLLLPFVSATWRLSTQRSAVNTESSSNSETRLEFSRRVRVL